MLLLSYLRNICLTQGISLILRRLWCSSLLKIEAQMHYSQKIPSLWFTPIFFETKASSGDLLHSLYQPMELSPRIITSQEALFCSRLSRESVLSWGLEWGPSQVLPSYATEAKNSASVHHWESFGWSRKEELYCFSRQKGNTEDSCLKYSVSQPGKIWWGVL